MSINFLKKGYLRGFTLLEVVVYVAIFAAAGVFITGILAVVLNVETRQSSENEISEQVVFLSDTMRRFVQEASLIDIPTSTPTSTLRLRMGELASDPTIFFASGTALYFEQGGGAPLSLTDSSVSLDFLTFRRFQSIGGPDIVEISLALSDSADNLLRSGRKTLRTAVTHLYAATFDSDLLPDSSSRKLGQNSGTTWQRVFVLDGDATAPAYAFGNASDVGIFKVSGQDTLGFSTNGSERLRINSSGNVGIGNSNPSNRLDVTGEVRFTGISNDGTGKVVCIKSNNTLGTCSNQPNSLGVCSNCN